MVVCSFKTIISVQLIYGRVLFKDNHQGTKPGDEKGVDYFSYPIASCRVKQVYIHV